MEIICSAIWTMTSWWVDLLAKMKKSMKTVENNEIRITLLRKCSETRQDGLNIAHSI